MFISGGPSRHASTLPFYSAINKRTTNANDVYRQFDSTTERRSVPAVKLASSTTSTTSTTVVVTVDCVKYKHQTNYLRRRCNLKINWTNKTRFKACLGFFRSSNRVMHNHRFVYLYSVTREAIIPSLLLCTLLWIYRFIYQRRLFHVRFRHKQAFNKCLYNKQR